ncbi:MAG TPA: saccharopine dehydrogenase NADP-binding domain-containing protein [Solirubrobacteraceae bacterium]
MPADRSYDIVIFGATGFTGGLTAEYLARNAPDGLRWALAGRNPDRLAAVRERLGTDVDLLTADATDATSLRAVAEATKVVLTTVGPYALHGEPLVAACAAAGTDYADLTGEPEFVDRMWLGYHEQAQQTGARLVHCCGFDSIPHDLGAYFTVKQLPEGVPLKICGYVRAGGQPSGGTYHSAINGFARARQTLAAGNERRKRESRPAARKIRAASNRVHKVDGRWAVPMPTVDPVIVRRSAHALERYGPEFTYGHYLLVKRLATVGALAGGVGTLFTLAQLPPARKLLLKARTQGEGPSPETRAKSWFKVRFHGEGGDKRVVTEVSGGDPGYDETAKMLSETGLCLALDDLPQTAGQVTTVQAMGDALLARLQAAGIGFRVVD